MPEKKPTGTVVEQHHLTRQYTALKDLVDSLKGCMVHGLHPNPSPKHEKFLVALRRAERVLAD